MNNTLANRSGWLFAYSVRLRYHSYPMWINAYRINKIPFYEGTGLLGFSLNRTRTSTPENDDE